jgi:hypothetical protein
MGTPGSLRPALLIYGALFLSVVGLSCGESGPQFYSVRGKVMYQGKPTRGALVVFHPLEAGPNAPRPSAYVEPDGSFKLGTNKPGDGAPAGNYAVAITWVPKDFQRKDDQTDLPNLLPERYGDPQKSQLRATVKAEDNVLAPFMLTK